MFSLFKTAAKAYNDTQSMKVNPSVSKPSVDNIFADFVKSSYNDAVDTIQGSEKLSMQSLQGKVDTTTVVTAISNAEVTLQAVLAIRDKFIAAYQDIMKMQI
ncbi:MAG: flagellar hook-basal body complex protein FliE [Alphaproteobacteria bacterium]|nr:flagellar hook-basal body complex protein FliE [Alphaproteobacteria bacterium]OJV13512.1 MAG: flagellar hook-basal body complex protein FliE [Alphaproteobacteria bacterium 33-17]